MAEPSLGTSCRSVLSTLSARLRSASRVPDEAPAAFREGGKEGGRGEGGRGGGREGEREGGREGGREGKGVTWTRH
jgi:hypothetical protein